ncbi:MAG TPA: pyrroline-5-carboxylate reductase [Verrucomicrobiales bacterium]|nr:pyrroline-5-carboxylate reductase [Verrucomicrobiales bacterium]
MDTNEGLKIGFLGAGKMATALARGFLAAGITSPTRMTASDPFEAARLAFQKETGARTAASNLEVLRASEVLILAVKPDQVPGVLAEVRPSFKRQHLLVSIAAGVTLARLEGGLPAKSRVIRVMPNTPALVGASATGFATGKSVAPGDPALATRLFGAVGVAFQVKEQLLDAVTGLSGSGPAYVYLMIEALSDGGVAAGLPREVATRLAAQTLLGGARMVLETGLHPGALKDMVTSPGGTTIEGIHQLEKAGLRAALMNAVRAASDKARQLGQG